MDADDLAEVILQAATRWFLEAGFGTVSVDRQVEVVLYHRLDRMLRTGWDRGILWTHPEVLSTIARAGLQELLRSDLPQQLDRSAADLLRSLVHTLLHGALRNPQPDRSGHPSPCGEQR